MNDVTRAIKSINDAVLRGIKARLADITPGPWHACKQGGCICGSVFGADENTMVAIAPTFDEADQIPNEEHIKANARFIAHAPADMMWFIEQLRIEQTENERRRGVITAALAAANEGKWNTVKTMLEAAHHD